jgi:hypothetical protein
MLNFFRWACLVAAVVLLLAVAGILLSSSQTDNPAYERAKSEDHKQEGDQKYGISLWDKWFPDSISLYTFFLFVFTGVLAYAAIYQFRFLNRAERIATATAQSAKDSADAAKKSADVAMAGQRAVVIPTPYGAPDGEGDKAGWVFGVSWENAGNLSTRKMCNYIDYRFIKGELPPDFQFPDGVQPLARGTMLGPKRSVLGPHVPKEGNINASQIAAIQSGERSLFFFGWAKYFDGFPDTPERVTKFCYQLRVTGNRETPFVFPPCARYNCADEGCAEDQ